MQCVRATGGGPAGDMDGRVRRFAIGQCRIMRPGAPIDDNLHRIMVNMDGSSRDMDYGGWDHMMEFFAFAKPTPGTERFTIGQAWEPHRVIIGLGLPDGWSILHSFYAYTTQQPGTERFAVGEAFSPHHRVMINLDGTGRDMDYDGWKHKLHFWVYPNTKSHVAAIGQARSNLWGLPHLSGLLERAFWSWAIYARNSRIVSQTERRDGMLQKVEDEIATQERAVKRMQQQEADHKGALQRVTTEWERVVDETEDLLYASMKKTSNAKGFSNEVQEIRKKSTDYKIAGAQLKAKMDEVLAKQRATKAKTDAVLSERAKQGKLNAEQKEREFLKMEAQKRQEQQVADSHRLAKIVAQGRGELESFINDEAEKAAAEAKAAADAAADAAAAATAAAAEEATRISSIKPVPPIAAPDAAQRETRWNRAQRLFKGGLVSSPAAVDAFRTADSLREAGQWEEAAEAYGTAIRLRHAATATCLNQRGVCLAELPDRLEDALADYTKALELTPHLAPVWHNRGVAQMTKGNLAAAAVDLQRAVELSDNAETAKLLDDVQAELASPDLAREAMKGALESYAHGEWGLSRRQFERALDLGEGRRSRCFNGIGLCWLEEEQHDRALEAFEQALEADPDNESASHNYNRLLDGGGV